MLDTLQIGFGLLLLPVFIITLGIAIWGYFDHQKAMREWDEHADEVTRRWAEEVKKMENMYKSFR